MGRTYVGTSASIWRTLAYNRTIPHTRTLPPSSRKPIAEVETYFQKAIELAQHQGTKLYELRATQNLAELYQGHEKEAAMMAQLATVYDWFTEGFDSIDLQEVQAVLKKGKEMQI